MAKRKNDKEQLSILLPSGRKESSFFEQVYEVTRIIPSGRVTTYGAIAAYLGTKKSARMVGWAMSGAHNQTNSVPAQRVVNRNGMLSGSSHFATPTLMQELLENEGCTIENNRVVNFEKVFWNPEEELKIDN